MIDNLNKSAGMAKLVDARDSKSRDGNIVPVQVRLSAPDFNQKGYFLMNDNCTFCKIINKEIPAKIIAENNTTIVIQDIAPQTPIHYLIIPKKHIKDMAHLTPEDRNYAADILLMAQQLSKADPENAESFRLVNNNGASVGQSVFHIHVHFCAGKKLSF